MQMELTRTEDWKDIYDDVPIFMSYYKDTPEGKENSDNTSVGRHSYHTGSVIRTLCPDAKIYLAPSTSYAFKWASDNGIDIISVSLSGVYALSSGILPFEEKILNLISAGNYGEDSMTATAKKIIELLLEQYISISIIIIKYMCLLTQAQEKN